MAIPLERAQQEVAQPGRGDRITTVAAICAGALLVVACAIAPPRTAPAAMFIAVASATVAAVLTRAWTNRTRSGFTPAELRRIMHEVEDLRLANTEIADRATRISAQHELITTNIAAAVTIRDLDGHTVFCSPYTLVLTGYSPEELCSYEGDFFAQLVLDDDLPRYERAQKVSSLAEDISVKYRIRHRSGLTIWLETRLVPVFDDEGELAAIMSVSIDVTDMLAYQRQIEEQNQDLSDFASMVSHDLKAPVFTIKGMAAALLEDHGTALGDDGRGLLQYIVDATLRLENLIASVLEYSSISAKEAPEKRIDLNAVVTTVIADFGELIRTKRASVTADSELPAIVGSEIRVYQVFSNLLGNALKYSSPDRPPVVTIRRRPTAAHTLVVEIEDNGTGIPSRKLPDIFRPFHRAHSGSIEGSGIGLACVKKIMDLMRGTVTVSSREGVGSIFTLSFPLPDIQPRQIPPELERCFEQ